MSSYRPLLAALHAVLGVLSFAPIVILSIVFGGATGIVGVASEDPEATAIVGLGLGVVLLIVTVVTAALGLLSLVTAWGVWKGARWGDAALVLLSVLQLTNFPLGTALSVFGLWVVLFREPASQRARPVLDREAVAGLEA